MKMENIEEIQSMVYTKRPFIKGACFKALPSREYACKVLLGIMFFLANTIFLFSLLDFNSKAYSLLLTLVCLATHFTILIMSKTFRPVSIAILTFMYLFMFLAPIAQLHGGLINTYIPKSGEVELTNFYVFVFYIIFIMVSNIKKTKDSKALNELNEIDYSSFKLYAFVSIASILFVIGKLGIGTILNAGLNSDNGKVQLLILTRIVFFTPVFLAGYVVCMKDKINKNYKLILFFTMIFCIIMQNPLNEKRNTLGPIYLSLLTISIISFIMKSNIKFFIFNFLLMGFAFPVSKFLTHKNETFENAFNLILLDNLRGLDYDAWPNFVASVGFTARVGFTNGQQLLGTLFFFIPRSVWINKPDCTGVLIGQYLIKNYSMWFDNLSFPYMAEGYIDFGIVGVIIFSIVLGFAVRWLESNIKENGYNRFAALYMAFVSYFVIRGSLMATFSYMLSAAFTLIIMPLIFKKIVTSINLRNNKEVKL